MIEQRDFLVDGERIPFGVGAEDGKTNVIGNQPAAMLRQAFCVGRKIRFEWSDDGGENSPDPRFVDVHGDAGF
jgi:hypothetical protein